MPKKKPSELAAGLFVVVGIAVLLGVVLWLGAADLLKTRGQRVSFHVPISLGSVGIIEGAEVTLGDGRIGRVVDITPDPAGGRCLYHALLERTDLRVKRDATAVVVSPPVGQAKVVLLRLGQADEDADDEHAVLLTGGLDQIMQQLNALATRLEAEMNPDDPNSVLAKVHGVVGKIRSASDDVAKIAANVRAETEVANAASLLAKVHKSAGDINLATGSLAGQMDANRPASVVAKISRAAGNIEKETDANQADSLVAKAHGTMDDVQGTVKEARPKITAMVDDLGAAAKDIRRYAKSDLAELLTTLRESSTEILKTTRNFAVVSEQAKQIVTLNHDNIDEIIDNMAQVSVNLKSASKEIRRNPWRLLYEPDKKELRSQNLYDAVRSFSNGAEQLDQAVAKLRALQQIKSDDPEFEKTTQKVYRHLMETFSSFNEAEQKLWKELQK